MSSLKRVNKALSELQASNLKSNQQAASELSRLLNNGNQQLEGVFERTLSEDAQKIEPLQYLTKGRAFPLLPEEKVARLGLVNSFLTSRSSGPEGVEPRTVQTYASIRGPYLTSSLENLNFSTINTAKKKSVDSVYKAGTNAIEKYAEAIEGLFMAEYENIRALFPRDDWGRVFTKTCSNAMVQLTKAMRELDVHIKANLTTDCFLGYEIMEVISTLSARLDAKTGELKPLFNTALKPIRETSKWSFYELLQETKSRLQSIQVLPGDGSSISMVTDIMLRLQTMANFLRPVEGLMFSLGSGGWRSNPLNKREDLEFDLKADGKDIFGQYCEDTIITFIDVLPAKAKMFLRSQMVQGAFMANNHAIVDRMIRTSDLAGLIGARMEAPLDKWRVDSRKLYLREWDDVSRILLDQIFTSRAAQRPPSGSAASVDSAAILKGMSSKEKDALKEKWKTFNTTFDDLLARHKSLVLEREVREMLAKAVQATIEPLYARFWDRYHEVDKGKGKYVKYDKGAISGVLMGLM